MAGLSSHETKVDMRALLILLCTLFLAVGCASTHPPAERPMDEVPRQTVLANGDRQYGFRNGCIVVLQPARAVLRSEGLQCALHHRDIALLYASGD